MFEKEFFSFSFFLFLLFLYCCFVFVLFSFSILLHFIVHTHSIRKFEFTESLIVSCVYGFFFSSVDLLADLVECGNKEKMFLNKKRAMKRITQLCGEARDEACCMNYRLNSHTSHNVHVYVFEFIWPMCSN